MKQLFPYKGMAPLRNAAALFLICWTAQRTSQTKKINARCRTRARAGPVTTSLNGQGNGAKAPLSLETVLPKLMAEGIAFHETFLGGLRAKNAP